MAGIVGIEIQRDEESPRLEGDETLHVLGTRGDETENTAFRLFPFK